MILFWNIITHETSSVYIMFLLSSHPIKSWFGFFSPFSMTWFSFFKILNNIKFYFISHFTQSPLWDIYTIFNLLLLPVLYVMLQWSLFFFFGFLKKFFYCCSVTVVPIFPALFSPALHTPTTHRQSSPACCLSMGPLHIIFIENID